MKILLAAQKVTGDYFQNLQDPEIVDMTLERNGEAVTIEINGVKVDVNARELLQAARALQPD